MGAVAEPRERFYDRLLIMPVKETDPPPCFEPLDGMEQVRRTSLTQLRTAPHADVHFPLGVDGLVSWDGGQGERMLAASDEFVMRVWLSGSGFGALDPWCTARIMF